jgi:hypothetical protein
VSLANAVPDVLATAATDLAGICSTLSSANAAASATTMAMLAAAEDEVSAAFAALSSAQGSLSRNVGVVQGKRPRIGSAQSWGTAVRMSQGHRGRTLIA